ncbi:hypothetical protein BCR32DRAFT_295569 [Anaeromyces robustus]|uniref:RING-CH-type domain-containing protein n=1 Tax=Anaeromyces robustus TaxID=1754192 RepID=A0A1Y1WW49_9FUNG|nr:hypothetical protein BCR32DRAFT_295569 [Anaeromyces robustus]|eukprot:ORX77538.1 hypothetical protein BCR32DRAFT_295569 [Anaeromyces robustus]
MDTNYYTCFICWESFKISDEKENKNVISCCRCQHHDYKYAHIDCIKYWVNSSNGSNKKCNICGSPYIMQQFRAPFITLLKQYCLTIYFYVLFLISIFIISIVTWARYMIPASVYIVVPIYNQTTQKYEQGKNTSLLYVESSKLEKTLVILETILFILISLNLGKILLDFMERKTNTNKLIGINCYNQLVSIDLEITEEKGKKKKNSPFSKLFFIKKFKSYLNDNENIPLIKSNTMEDINVTMV